MMTTYTFDYDHRRTISNPPERARAIRTASEYLGVSGERLIWDAVTAYLRFIHGMMFEDAEG